MLRHDSQDRGQVPPGGPAAAPQHTIVAAPDEVRDHIRNLTRMRRLRICAAWRPDATGYRDPAVATRLSLKSLARRVLALNEEIAKLDRFIAPLVKELAPDLLKLEGRGIRQCGRAAGHRGRKSRPAALRSKLRDVVRRLPAPRLKREDATPPPQSRWEPPSQLRPAHDRRVPDAHRPANPRLCREAYRGRPVQTRGHALPETLRGPRNLPCPHRPITHLTNMRASAVRTDFHAHAIRHNTTESKWHG